MGNPPFHGFTFMTAEQKTPICSCFFLALKTFDFVCRWCRKKLRTILQEQRLKYPLYLQTPLCRVKPSQDFRISYQKILSILPIELLLGTVKSTAKAHVHCVIIGFAKFPRAKKYLYDNKKIIVAKNINSYLFDGENILVRSRNTPICNVPKMIYGNKPADGGNLIIEDDELQEFIAKDPNSKKYIHPLLGAAEYIKGNKRFGVSG